MGHEVSCPLPEASKSRLNTRGQGLGSRLGPSAWVWLRECGLGLVPQLCFTGQETSAQMGQGSPRVIHPQTGPEELALPLLRPQFSPVGSGHGPHLPPGAAVWAWWDTMPGIQLALKQC